MEPVAGVYSARFITYGCAQADFSTPRQTVKRTQRTRAITNSGSQSIQVVEKYLAQANAGAGGVDTDLLGSAHGRGDNQDASAPSSKPMPDLA